MAKRVLVTGAANIGTAGVATIVYKWGQEFDSNILVYDYLMQKGLPDEQYQKMIQKKGGVMHTLDKKRNMISTVKWVTDTIKENHYDTIHINSDSAYIAAAYTYAAKKAGVSNIYVHSHCTQIDDTNLVRRTIKTLLHIICKPYVCANTKMFLACSKLAGVWMFGKRNTHTSKYKTIYNGVEVEKYLLNSSSRLTTRKAMGLQNKQIIINIGRLSYQKNQSFLIKVFAKYHELHQDAVLVIVGDGELKQRLQEQVKQAGLGTSITFLGNRSDVPELLSAADILVMPSRFEGLPVTMVEAQMASLPCVVSSNITEEAKFTAATTYVHGWNDDDWVKAIDAATKNKRVVAAKEKQSSIFNIKNSAKELQAILLG